MKAIYHPQGDILTVKAWSSPSYVLHSLLRGWVLVTKGYHWSTGSGDNVRVTTDPWLSRPTHFSIYNPPLLPPDLRMTDLRLGNGQWDTLFIDHNFNSADTQLIKRILIG